MEKNQENQNAGVTEKEAKATVVENPNLKIITLKSPLNIDGALFNEIKLDFGKMTGVDVLKIDEELKSEGYPDGFNSVANQQVCVRLASRASGILVDDLARLGIADFAEVTFSARNFFFE
ncbi:phage tail assembly protein [Lysinibacillus xylanilyticus]|uniref:phage tail assembly protein n=1 Tax=Lysinibacillus xylanilyticus TaxID=582475 RepID=UPI003D014F2D